MPKEMAMKRFHITLVSLGALMIILPATAHGQTSAGEFSAGWRVMSAEEETFTKGWYVDAMGNVANWFGVVGEVSGHYKSIDRSQSPVPGVQVNVSADGRIHTFMGGARVSARRNPRLVPFVQALFGLAHASASATGSATIAGQTFTIDESETTSDGAVEFGGGVNIGVTDTLGLRFSAAYFRVLGQERPRGGEDTSDAFRFAAGVVFPF
jgi:opacity protein-like surface antigen